VGRAAWLLDHDATTYEHLAQLFAGHPYGAITRDDWLENVSLYWLTNTATSAARLYWQQAITGKNFYAAANVFLPAAVTVFPSPPGNNRNCFPKSCARRSAHCVEGERGECNTRVRRHPHAPPRYERVSAEAPCENLHKLLGLGIASRRLPDM
jgi:hypothetical protein